MTDPKPGVPDVPVEDESLETTLTNPTYKVLGELAEAGGVGVLGRNTAESGTSHGVLGVTDSIDAGASGVYGEATGTELETATSTYGVQGITQSSDTAAAGVSAEAPAGEADAIRAASTGGGNGLLSRTDGSGNYGVYAYNTASTGTYSMGVRGDTQSSGNGAAGVFGFNDPNGVATTYGVRGFTYAEGDGSNKPAGVRGEAATGGSAGPTYGVHGTTNSDDPGAAGVTGETNGADGFGVYSRGDARVEGDQEMTGELSFSDGTPQRTAGPIAKGYINSNGSVANATPNVTSTWSSSDSWYEITIANESYFFNQYATNVTTATDTHRATVDSTSGTLLVKILDTSDSRVQGGFQFVTHKLP